MCISTQLTLTLDISNVDQGFKMESPIVSSLFKSYCAYACYYRLTTIGEREALVSMSIKFACVLRKWTHCTIAQYAHYYVNWIKLQAKLEDLLIFSWNFQVHLKTTQRVENILLINSVENRTQKKRIRILFFCRTFEWRLYRGEEWKVTCFKALNR